ncbi:response regulator [Trichothermofontia sp.]
MLLVEDNLAEARLLQEVLKGMALHPFLLVHVQRLQDAFQQLQEQSFAVALLDLTLPDSTGLDSLDALIARMPSLPIVVLTNTNDEELAIEAVRHGAQDYIVKRHINQELLVRSLRYAIERKQNAEALRETNEILEQRVQERTAELKAANELLRQEIEARQRVQRRLELAQKAGKIGTFEWNIRSNQVTWSPELEALYGLAAGSFGEGYELWLQVLHPDDRDRTEQELWQAIANNQGLNTEFRICWSATETRWLAVKSSLFQDDRGRPLRMIGIHMDITEKKQLEAQFLRAQRLESLGTLASGIAHDLNNILTPILAVVQLLPMKVPNLDERTQHLLQTLETSAQRGADLVKQILSFARGVEGKRVSLQVEHLLIEVRRMLQQTLPKSIEIQLDIAPQLWPVFADATQLHQVWMNLCVNARDAMPDGGILKIAAANCEVDEAMARRYLDAQVGRYVVVSVADTGIGMPASILNRVFDPFFTTKPVGKGTGLGLSAVMGIVKSHGGFIDVVSEVHKGSEFRIFLPASQPSSPPAQDSLAPLLGHQELILVVDDETAICEITKATLETYNYRVLTANDALSAIALVAEYQDQLQGILIDLMMPVMDGLSTIPLIRHLRPNLAIVAMSGLGASEPTLQAEKLGVQYFLPKPFTTKELLEVLYQVQKDTQGLSGRES